MASGDAALLADAAGVVCTACGADPADARMHPALGVVVCGECHAGLLALMGEDGAWSEESLRHRCHLCANPDKYRGIPLRTCSANPAHSFCASCIARNSGAERSEELLAPRPPAWDCYLCDPAQLESVAAVSAAFMQTLAGHAVDGDGDSDAGDEDEDEEEDEEADEDPLSESELERLRSAEDALEDELNEAERRLSAEHLRDLRTSVRAELAPKYKEAELEQETDAEIKIYCEEWTCKRKSLITRLDRLRDKIVRLEPSDDQFYITTDEVMEEANKVVDQRRKGERGMVAGGASGYASRDKDKGLYGADDPAMAQQLHLSGADVVDDISSLPLSEDVRAAHEERLLVEEGVTPDILRELAAREDEKLAAAGITVRRVAPKKRRVALQNAATAAASLPPPYKPNSPIPGPASPPVAAMPPPSAPTREPIVISPVTSPAPPAAAAAAEDGEPEASASTFCCSLCEEIFHGKVPQPHPNPLLHDLPVCRACAQDYAADVRHLPVTRDASSGEERRCQWCASTGEYGQTLVACAQCHRFLCKSCCELYDPVRSAANEEGEDAEPEQGVRPWICIACDERSRHQLAITLNAGSRPKRAQRQQQQQPPTTAEDDDNDAMAARDQDQHEDAADDMDVDGDALPPASADSTPSTSRGEEVTKPSNADECEMLEGDSPDPAAAADAPVRQPSPFLVMSSSGEEEDEAGGEDEGQPGGPPSRPLPPPKRRKVKSTITYAGDESGLTPLPKPVKVKGGDNCFCVNPDESDHIYLPAELSQKLKPHQKEGIQFMWRKCIMDKNPAIGGGCILAHSMGLGKTLQVTALLLAARQIGLEKFLVLGPKSTLTTWRDELLSNFPEGMEMRVTMIESTSMRRAEDLVEWHRLGGALLLGYDLFCSLTKKLDGRLKARLLSPDVVVLDEGHTISNTKTVRAQCVRELKTARRVVLTGTPLQNRLEDLHTLVEIVRPGLLDPLPRFRHRFVQPCKKGSFVDSETAAVRLMQQRLHVLHKKVEPIMHRKGFEILTASLPAKKEFVLSVHLSPLQVRLYEQFLAVLAATERSYGFVGLFRFLQPLLDHPLFLRAPSETEQSATAKELRADLVEAGLSPDLITGFERLPRDWWVAPCSNVKLSLADGGKLPIALALIKTSIAAGEKVLLFSQSLAVLDVVGTCLSALLRSADGTAFREGRDYDIFNGSCSTTERLRMQRGINDPAAPCKVILISIKAGGVGINLVGASRAILYDVSINPATDLQAIFRCYRFGQVRPVVIYRLVCHGCLEEKLYIRATMKQMLAVRVVDQEPVKRFFKTIDCEELLRLDADEQAAEGHASAADTLAALDLPAEAHDALLARVQDHASFQHLAAAHLHRVESRSARGSAESAPAAEAAAADGALEDKKTDNGSDEADADEGSAGESASGQPNVDLQDMIEKARIVYQPITDDPQDAVLSSVFQSLGPMWIRQYHMYESLLIGNPDDNLTPEEKEQAMRDFENLERANAIDKNAAAIQAIATASPPPPPSSYLPLWPPLSSAAHPGGSPLAYSRLLNPLVPPLAAVIPVAAAAPAPDGAGSAGVDDPGERGVPMAE